jgi:hypothetical protein
LENTRAFREKGGEERKMGKTGQVADTVSVIFSLVVAFIYQFFAKNQPLTFVN